MRIKSITKMSFPKEGETNEPNEGDLASGMIVEWPKRKASNGTTRDAG